LLEASAHLVASGPEDSRLEGAGIVQVDTVHLAEGTVHLEGTGHLEDTDLQEVVDTARLEGTVLLEVEAIRVVVDQWPRPL